MGFKQWIAKLRGNDNLPQIAERIAEKCLDATWSKIEPRASEMQIAELRGYVRARTRTDVEASIRNNQESAQLDSERVMKAVMDEIARLAVARVLMAPAPLVTLRQAA